MFISEKKSIIVLCFLILPFSSNAQIDIESYDTNVNLISEGCNNNSVCEPLIGESINNCPLDCNNLGPVEENKSRRSRAGSRINLDNNIKPDIDFDFLPIFSTYTDIKNIKISVENKRVNLNWINPIDLNFEYVRVMKNIRYSNNPYDGILVYEGQEAKFTDTLENFDTNYYYSFFSRYSDGTFSIGQVFKIYSDTPSIFEDLNNDLKEQVEKDKEIKINIPFEKIFFSENLSIYDFKFIQEDKEINWEDQVLFAKPEILLTISLPKKDFFGPIRDIFVELDFYNERNELIRQDFSKLEYSSVDQKYFINVSNLKEKEKIHFKSSMLDDNGKESKISGVIEVMPYKKEQKTDSSNQILLYLIFILIIIILGLINKKIKGITSI